MSSKRFTRGWGGDHGGQGDTRARPRPAGSAWAGKGRAARRTGEGGGGRHSDSTGAAGVARGR
eukprot:1705644-Pleurochrysis_carterae.AAC.1